MIGVVLFGDCRLCAVSIWSILLDTINRLTPLRIFAQPGDMVCFTVSSHLCHKVPFLDNKIWPGRPGGCPTRPPTDPDVRNSRIRFLGKRSLGTAPLSQLHYPACGFRLHARCWGVVAGRPHAVCQTSPT